MPLLTPPPLPLAPFTCRLPHRSLLRVSGTDAHGYLQGLFTNDVTLLHPGGSQWGCFLYFTGRVLCDAHLYQARTVYRGQASILVDVHHDMREALQDHLVEMKMRKRVKIEDVSASLAIAATLEEIVDDKRDRGQTTREAGSCSEEAAGSSTMTENLAETFTDPRSRFMFPPPTGAAPQQSSHPRWELRKKIVPVAWAPPVQPVFTKGLTTPLQSNNSSSSSKCEGESTDAIAAADAFQAHPYTTVLLANGIGEGPAVFRDNKTLPFEMNTDFLEGVHFHKGCYVGQELTHRTHVMLVTRKRTVPLFFPTTAAGPAAAENYVGEGLFINQGKEKVGEITAGQGAFGIGILRLRYVDKETKGVADLTRKDGSSVVMHLPTWWPSKQVKKLLKNN